MNAQSQSWFSNNPLIQKLNATTGLTETEQQAILQLPHVIREFQADEAIAEIGDRPSVCSIMLEGWACRYKMVAEDSRQIMSFHLAGDIVDVQSVFLKTMDHSIAALTPLKLALVQHRDVHELLRRLPGISVAFWRDALVESAIFREWLVGIGRRTAHQRIAHVLCEMATKARVVGLNDGYTFPWPITQTELADALGLSSVHVNRVIGDLKGWGLVTFSRKTFVADDWKGLKALAQFDPDYLHLDPRVAA